MDPIETYDAYLFVNGDANQSNTYFKERVGDNQGIPVNQVTEKLHSINMSYGGGGSQTCGSQDQTMKLKFE